MSKKWSPVERAVIRTLVYADIFSGTLSFQELYRFLMSDSPFSRNQVRDSIEILRQNEKTKSLVDRVYIGESSRHFPVEKWRAVVKMVRLLSRIPWIESIWITGSLAVGNAQEQDDIDILFITTPRRLWLTRFLVVTIGILLGTYRRYEHTGTRVTNHWCCNIWLESDALAVFQQKQDPYIAREMIQAFPVYRRLGSDPTYWLHNNSWIAQWCYSGFHHAVRRAEKTFMFVSTFPKMLDFVEDGLNYLLYKLQMLSIRSKQTREEVYFNHAFFHPSYTHENVLEKYEKMCAEYLL